MSYTLPGGLIPVGDVQGPFPLDPPGFNWQRIKGYFWPAWFDAPDGQYDFVEITWFTAGSFGININSVASSIAQTFANYGEGTPLAMQLFHRQVFDVDVPDQYCLPAELPFGVGGCHDIPIIGGQNIVSGDEWHLQVIYHNPLPAIIVIAGVIVALVASVVVIDRITHGQFQLTRSFLELLEQLTPAGEAKAITSVIFVAVGAIVGLALLFPKLGGQIGGAFRTGSQMAGNVRTASRSRSPINTAARTFESGRRGMSK